jgi:protein phosphatase
VSDPNIILVPDPSVIVLVGVAGSGKSTFAARHFASDEILSSDAFRARIGRDEADQSVTRAAFGALHRALATRVRAGRLTVVDATNVTESARRTILARARAAGVPAIAIVLDLPLEAVHAANRGRVRVVAPDVIRAQAADLRRTLEPGRLGTEGFARVVTLRDAAARNTVRIVRHGPIGT